MKPNSIITGVRPLNIENRRASLEGDLLPQHRPPEFPRAPREYTPYPDEEINIMLPPASPAEPSTSLATILLSIVGPLMMVAIGVYASAATGQGGQAGGIPIYAFISLPIALVTLVSGLMKYRSDKKKYKQQVELRNSKYEEYLGKKVAQLLNLAQAQRDASMAAHPGLRDCSEIAQKRIPTKLWDRENGDPDFLDIRLGIGETTATFSVKIPEQSQFQIIPDPLEEKARELAPRFAMVDNLIVSLPLLQIGAAGFIGKSERLVNTTRALLVHLATHHAPSEVKIVVISSTNEAREWDWVRWLPHNWSDGREVRFFANDAASQASVMAHIETILKQRANQQINHEDSTELLGTVFVIVFADIHIWRGRDAIKFSPVLDLILKKGPTLGAFPIFLAGKISRVPKACKAVVDLQNSLAILKFLGTAPRKYSFTSDTFDLFDTWNFAQSLAPIRLEEAGGGAANLPATITLAELIGAAKIEDINILKIWDESKPDESLAVPIGIGAGGKRLLLDLHEKYDGPHGLVAGTTGSGKTALLSTYLALAALNYHPHELGFIGIDYKGGDLIRDLKDLPHMIGTMTNLDGSGTDRAIKILRGEVKKRQGIFNKAGIGNIYEYQRMHRKDPQKWAAMPHLVIVCDEFAELKKEQPDFIRELVSISRVGRSLGIHLILATQKPAGVVSDEIWANSHFHLCLKVASLEDSREMLRRPEAADITQKGRAYFQVGMNEIFELFQAAWGDAPYTPDDKFSQQPRLNRINTDGSRKKIWPPESKTSGTGNTQIQELANHIMDVCAKNNIQRLDGIWPPALSEQAGKTISQIEITTGWNGQIWKNPSPNLRPLLGTVDNPDFQRQEILRIDLETDGHLAIFGAPGSGKTTAMQTLVTSLCSEHTPEQVHLYLLDFAGRTMNIFEQMPHVGAVITNGENERLRRFFGLLTEEMERRKKLVENDQNMATYRLNHPKNTEADIVVVLDGFSHFVEAFKNQILTTEMDNIVRLASQGSNLGLHLIVSTDQVKSFPAKLLGNIKAVISTELNDNTDYPSIVGRTGGLYPPKDAPGRGLMKGVPVKEFQIALPAESTLEIRKMGDEMDQAWKGNRPRLVPVLQDLLELSEILHPDQAKLAPKPGLPVSLALDLSKPDLPHLDIHLEPGAQFWVSGLSQSGKTSLLQTWLLSLAKCYSTDAIRFYLLDFSWGNLEALQELPHTINCIADAAELKTIDIKEVLKDFLNIDLTNPKPALLDDATRPTVVFAIDGIGAFQKATTGSNIGLAEKNRDFLLSLLRVKNARFHMIGAGLPSEFAGGMTTNPLGETLRSLQRGVWLGDGTNSEASNFSFQFNQGENLKGLPKGSAFIVNKGKYTPVKLATCHYGNPVMEGWIENICQESRLLSEGKAQITQNILK